MLALTFPPHCWTVAQLFFPKVFGQWANGSGISTLKGRDRPCLVDHTLTLSSSVKFVGHTLVLFNSVKFVGRL